MPDPQVVEVMRGFKQSLLANELAQMRQMAERWLDVERALSNRIAALAEEFARLAAEGQTLSQAKLFRMERYQSLLAQLMQELRRYTDYAEDVIVSQQRNYGQMAIRHAAIAIDASVTDSVGAAFDRLPVSAVENMVGLAGDGSPLRQLLVDAWPDAAQGLTSELIRSTALGINPRETARRMANGTTRTLNRMLTVARTEQLRVYKEASRQAYITSGVVEGYFRIATHDSRVCPACMMDDGQFYELDEVMPEHPSGRCAMIPKVIGIGAPKWEKGVDWFKRQQPTTQQSILGKGRFAAWQDGKFDLDQMVTVRRNATWGNSLQSTPLYELVGA